MHTDGIFKDSRFITLFASTRQADFGIFCFLTVMIFVIVALKREYVSTF